MPSRASDTFAAAEGRPAGDGCGCSCEQRVTALLRFDRSLHAGGSHVSLFRLCDKCQAGTRRRWAISRHWNGRVRTKNSHACSHSPGRPAESSRASASADRSSGGATHQGRSGPPACKSTVFDAKYHQAGLRTVSGRFRCNIRCHGQCQGSVPPERVASGGRHLKAPFSGYILSRNIDQGSFASPAMAAFTIADIDRVKVAFGAPDYVLGRVRLGQELLIQTRNDVSPLKGRVTSISPAADARNRIFAIEVTVENRDRHLKPGMIATVSLGEVPHPSVTVPLSAIVASSSEPDQFAVMVAQQRGAALVATLRRVQLGTTQGSSVAVEGVMPGERVVSVGAQLLRDGDSIQVIP